MSIQPCNLNSIDPYFYAIDLGLTGVLICCFHPFSALPLDLGSRVPVRSTRAFSVCGSAHLGTLSKNDNCKFIREQAVRQMKQRI